MFPVQPFYALVRPCWCSRKLSPTTAVTGGIVVPSACHTMWHQAGVCVTCQFVSPTGLSASSEYGLPGPLKVSLENPAHDKQTPGDGHQCLPFHFVVFSESRFVMEIADECLKGAILL